MRRLPALATLCLALALPGGALAETLSKPIRNAVPAKAGGTIVLENLAGTLEVVAGRGAEAVLSGTVCADAGSPSESQRLLDAVAVESKDGGNRATLHVTYPVDRSPFRYRGEKEGGSPWSLSSSTVDYQGRRVEGDGGRELQTRCSTPTSGCEVPPGVAVRVTNHLGRVTARGVGADARGEDGVGRRRRGRRHGSADGQDRERRHPGRRQRRPRGLDRVRRRRGGADPGAGQHLHGVGRREAGPVRGAEGLGRARARATSPSTTWPGRSTSRRARATSTGAA